MVYFTSIEPTEHYLKEHAQEVPWHEVVEIIFSTKNPRKKGDKFEIVCRGYYVLFELRNNVIYVVNAKRT